MSKSACSVSLHFSFGWYLSGQQQLRMEMNGSWRTTFLRKNKTDKLYKLNYVSIADFAGDTSTDGWQCLDTVKLKVIVFMHGRLRSKDKDSLLMPLARPQKMFGYQMINCETLLKNETAHDRSFYWTCVFMRHFYWSCGFSDGKRPAFLRWRSFSVTTTVT